MAKVKIEASAEAIEEAGADTGDFVVPPKGIYILELMSVEPGYKKTDDGEDRSQPNLKCGWKIVGEGREGKEPQANYGWIYDYVTFGESAEWKRAEFLRALGFKKGASIEIEEGKPGTVIGKKVLGRTKIEKRPEYDDAAKIAKLLPLVTDADDEDAFADDTSDEDTGEDDPFAGDEEGADEDGEDGGDEASEDDLLTMEDLEAMEPKELAATAKDFDVDISSFEGKGRSAAAKKKDKMKQVMEAILEAQGDGGEGEDDDEDPF